MVDQDLRDTLRRMIDLQMEQSRFNNEVTAAISSIGERLDRIEQRLDQLSRAIQPRAVSTPFARPAERTGPPRAVEEESST